MILLVKWMPRKPRGRAWRASCALRTGKVWTPGAHVGIYSPLSAPHLDWLQPRPYKEWRIFFLSGEHYVHDLATPFTWARDTGQEHLLLSRCFLEVVAALTSRHLWASAVVAIGMEVGPLTCLVRENALFLFPCEWILWCTIGSSFRRMKMWITVF